MAHDDRMWRARLDELVHLPVSPMMAIRFIELGKDPDVGVDDYVQVAQSDASLSSKLLGLANSAWVSARHEVTTVKQAISMLGGNRVRALATSSCLASLHATWKLEPEMARSLWLASLCKAVAARLLAEPVAPERADEAFALGLFQDVGIGLFSAVGGNAYRDRLASAEYDVSAQISDERSRFGADHAECGRAIAEKLDLPALYVHAIGGHHHGGGDEPASVPPSVLSSLEVAALLPHVMTSWRAADVGKLGRLLPDAFPGRFEDTPAFITVVQSELDELVRMLTQGAETAPLPAEFTDDPDMNERNSVSVPHDAFRSISAPSDDLTAKEEEVCKTCDDGARARQDPLTGLLNRQSFLALAEAGLSPTGEMPPPVGMAIFNLDHFRQVNDAHGRRGGDLVLKEVAERLNTLARSDDLVCRWGGDEIVVMWMGLDRDDCVAAAHRCIRVVRKDPVVLQDQNLCVSVTGGLVWLKQPDADCAAERLVKRAASCLHRARQLERGILVCEDPVYSMA